MDFGVPATHRVKLKEKQNMRTSGDHPNYSIVEIGQNTKQSPENLRRLAVTQNSSGKPLANIDVKNSQINNNNDNNNSLQPPETMLTTQGSTEQKTKIERKTTLWTFQATKQLKFHTRNLGHCLERETLR